MKKSVLVLAFVLMMSGCSTKFGYNNLDWLIHWYVDDYVEFTRPQERLFDEKFMQIMRWHRAEELAKYKLHLHDIKRDLAEGSIDAKRIQQHMDRGREHFQRFRTELTPQMAMMASELTEDQITYFFAALEKDNVEQEEDILEDLEEGEMAALETRIDNITEDIEGEIGRLSQQQKDIIAKYAPEFRASGLMWLQYRRNIQSAARAMFAVRHRNPDFESELIALMMDTDGYRSEAYRQAREQNKLSFVALLAELIPTITDKQKRKLNKRIDDIIEDLDDLMET